MTAFLGNLSATEIFVVGIVAVLIFGKRLPEVASQTYGQIRKLREGMDQFRRETGIDREMRSIGETLNGVNRDLQQGMTIDPRPAPTASAPVAPALPPVEPVPCVGADAASVPPAGIRPMPAPRPPPGAPSAEPAPPPAAVPPQDPGPGS